MSSFWLEWSFFIMQTNPRKQEFFWLFVLSFIISMRKTFLRNHYLEKEKISLVVLLNRIWVRLLITMSNLERIGSNLRNFYLSFVSEMILQKIDKEKYFLGLKSCFLKSPETISISKTPQRLLAHSESKQIRINLFLLTPNRFVQLLIHISRKDSPLVCWHGKMMVKSKQRRRCVVHTIIFTLERHTAPSFVNVRRIETTLSHNLF